MQPMEKSGTHTPAAAATSDSTLEKDLKAAFGKAADLAVKDLKVRVQDGKATLDGNVDDKLLIQRAAAIADRFPGIKGVVNNIACVKGTDSAAPKADEPKAATDKHETAPAAKAEPRHDSSPKVPVKPETRNSEQTKSATM